MAHFFGADSWRAVTGAARYARQSWGRSNCGYSTPSCSM